MENNSIPSMDEWLREAKADESAPKIGMYLVHNGVVRGTAKAMVRRGEKDTLPVKGMEFSYDPESLERLRADTLKMDGIYYIRVWLNSGVLKTGDDLMYVLIGGDIRPHVVDALQFFVGTVKEKIVKECEMF